MQVSWDLTPKSTIKDRKSDIIQSVRAGAVELGLHAYNSWNKDFANSSEYFDYKETTLEDMYFKGEIEQSVGEIGEHGGNGYMTLSFGEGDEGGPATIHVIWECIEHHQQDYKAWHAKGRKGKIKSLGYEITWTIRVILWDFDTMIGEIYNSTMPLAQSGKKHNPWKDDRIPPMEVTT